MKKLMARIDRFCILHPKFGIRNLMLYIVIGNAVVWLFGMMDTQGILTGLLQFDAQKIFTQGQIWRLVSFALVPENGGILMLIALYFYYFIGSTLERQWGPGKFTIYYLVGVLANVLYGIIIWFATDYNIGISATYLNLSMFFAFAVMYPDMRVLLFFIIPVKMKWLAYLDAAMFLVAVIQSPFPVNLIPVVALLNFLLFFGSYLLDMVRPAKIKQKSNTVNFKKAAKKYNAEQAKKPYTRKCEVCGKTDTENPNLEFRFCSKCGGYHCFCIDHINSHLHFDK